ncbi:ChrR family anti-sigma-E factor [Roseibium aestuarii]|uniref:ChrR family anti-sigma-E factor n=1 Tax=Roseibium aestuarii TaxID=2600299 RepID=A0ABW4JRL8_9HYPH|nr:ChrR family anti-sigma-E factor [Roseibium aestuarii]
MSDCMEKNVTGLDELLAGYAAGSLAMPAHVLVGAHLELRDTHRSYVHQLETLGGAGMEDCAPVALADRDSLLARILATEPAPRVSGASHPATRSGDAWMPSAIRPLLGRSGAEGGLVWKTLLPGVKECKLGEIDGCATSFLWVRAGKAMPSHTHSGTELTLVLQGGFSDSDGHFGKGDIAFADHEIDHKPIADDDGEDCICFTVTEGSLRLTGPIGRLFAPFMR